MEYFDIVVIGAGIHGAGVAQAASCAGYSCLVLEQTDIASGTSSRSSKLIHGGLRYLEQAEFGLVRECLHERAVLLRIAPDLVSLKPFYVPIYAHTRRRPWQLRVGLSLYSLLAGYGPGSGFRRIPRRTWPSLDGLDTEGLQAVFQYWDGRTDDAALTRAVIRSACDLGAQLRVPAQLEHAAATDSGWEVVYRDHRDRAERCRARVLVNAAGPWVNHVLDKLVPAQPRTAVDLVQGTHIVVAGSLQRGCYYLEAPADRRAVFAMPWQDKILVGTTESAYQGDPSLVAPTTEEQHYLIDTLKHYFPAYRSAVETPIISAFAGLRVLPRATTSAFQRSRETLLQVDDDRRPTLVSIYGGKLTAYRATADKVIRRIAASLPARRSIGDTKKIILRPD